MFIRYKVIEHERTEDAPFVGALISAIGCNIGCKNCFNQHLKTAPTLYATAEELIEMVKVNPFNEGIIMAGLEWSDQPEELVELVQKSLDQGLNVMIYTGYSLDVFMSRVPALETVRGTIYLKHGAYVPQLESTQMYGVQLASSNQRIDVLSH